MFISTVREFRELIMSQCRAMGRGKDLNPAVLAYIAARVAEGWKVARLHRELPFVKRGTLKRKVTNIRRGDSGQRKLHSAPRAKLHGAAVGACIKGAVSEGRSLACMRDQLASHFGVFVTREAIRRIPSFVVIASEFMAGRRRTVTQSKDSCDVAKEAHPIAC